MIEEEKKFLKLLEILGHYQEKGSVIIFVDKQEHADSLLKDLMKASYPCMSLHGGQQSSLISADICCSLFICVQISSTFDSDALYPGIDQYDRDSIINDFKNGACRLLVATSVAARGLDVKHLILVVNYNCPNHYEDYVHRAGRTGRAGNKVSPSGSAAPLTRAGREAHVWLCVAGFRLHLHHRRPGALLRRHHQGPGAVRVARPRRARAAVDRLQGAAESCKRRSVRYDTADLIS